MASAADQMAANISLANFAKATDLKKRLWFTIGALIVFRLLSFVPLPGIWASGSISWRGGGAATWTDWSARAMPLWENAWPRVGALP